MNSKHCQIFLFLGFTVLSSGLVLYTLKAVGVPIRPAQYIMFIPVWIMYCAVIGPFTSSYQLFRRSNVRKPTFEEEVKLTSLFSDVQGSSRFGKIVRLRVCEESGLEAFATGDRTIAISKGMLKVFTDDEMKGVLAHELGHLESRDCRLLAAISVANSLPYMLHRCVQKLVGKIKGCFFYLVLIFPLGLFGMFFMITHIDHFWNLFPFLIFFFLYPSAMKLFTYLVMIVSRFREYRQDAYAFSLGYGKGLLDALHKLTTGADMPVNRYRTIMSGSHPVIYNRIRRLERLLGMRDQD